MVIFAVFLVTNRLGPVEGQQKKTPGEGFAAVPGLKGGQDVFGPYDPVQNWPRPLAESLPNHEGWTWSQATDVFAESPDRVIVAQKGELPVLPAGAARHDLAAADGAQHQVPRRRRRAGARSRQRDSELGKAAADGSDGRPGVDWRWEHVIAVFDRNGKMIEDWSQWDKIWGRPHDVEISPYDPEKHIWIVDADNHFVSQVHQRRQEAVLMLGTPGVPGTDDTHFARPTFMAFMDANTWYLADGYDNTRVIKYDMNGKKLLEWGMKGTQPNETTSRLFQQRARHRGQPEDAPRLRERPQQRPPAGVRRERQVPRPVGFRSAAADEHPQHHMGANGVLWAADQGSNKLLGYDANGNFLYSWGTFGTCQGCMWGVHGFATDKDGNLYTAEVRTGRVQKYAPRKGANQAFSSASPGRGSGRPRRTHLEEVRRQPQDGRDMSDDENVARVRRSSVHGRRLERRLRA